MSPQSYSTFFSLYFSKWRGEKEPETSTGNTLPKLILSPKQSALKVIRTKIMCQSPKAQHCPLSSMSRTSKDCQASEESLCVRFVITCAALNYGIHSVMGARNLDSPISLTQSSHLINMPEATQFSPSPLSTLLVVLVPINSHSDT